jgi:hypothetical protein
MKLLELYKVSVENLYHHRVGGVQINVLFKANIVSFGDLSGLIPNGR